MKTFLLAQFSLLILISNISCERDQNLKLENVRKSIFKIYVISSDPKFGQPWQYQNKKSSSGSGFFIGNDRILTNAHVVSNGKFIRVQKDGDDHPVIAEVEYIAHDCDLAILKVKEEKYFDSSFALEFGDLPKLRDKVATIGYPRGGEQISITEGVVSRVSFRRYAHSADDFHLLVQVDSAINSGNSGGPVMQNNKVIGVAFQAHTRAENTGYIIPTPVINRFLRDVADGHYDGHPEDGLLVMEGSLENKGTQEYFGLQKSMGVKVSFIAKYSAFFGKLQADDVLLKIQNSDIGIDGKINYQDERIDFKVLFDLTQVGETISLEVLRDKQIFNVSIVMKKREGHYDSSSNYALRPRYFVFGGLVFTALSRDYLQVWGDQWYQNAPLELRYLHRFEFVEPRFDTVKDIIILAEILPDKFNSMADSFKEAVMDQVDGVDVNSLEQLENLLLEKKDKRFIEIAFWNRSQPLVLDRNEAIEINSSLLDKFGVEPSKWFGSKDDDGAISGKGT